MPFMDGFTFLEELAKVTDVKKAKVVVLSNLGQPEDIERAKKLGAIDYLVKSDLSMKDVVEKINYYLKK
jgi:DNA-binding NarL/FixJ family response regulator